MTPALFCATALCGACGAMARAFTMDRLRHILPVSFPWTTVVVNITACFLIGLVLDHDLLPAFQTMVATGFLGGYSTMSTLNDDAVSLVRSGKILHFALYMLITYGGCLTACLAGIYLF